MHGIETEVTAQIGVVHGIGNLEAVDALESRHGS
jgi:hypothetical protein